MQRRELWETIVDVVDSINTPDSERFGIRITEVKLALPVEISLPRTEVGFKVYIDLPQWRRASGFEPSIGRMTLHLREEVINDD